MYCKNNLNKCIDTNISSFINEQIEFVLTNDPKIFHFRF